MLKRSIDTLVQKFNEINAYDRRLDPKGTGWYFPGEWDSTVDSLPPSGESPYPESDEMIRLIDEGIAETEREMATYSRTIAVTALKDTINPPS